MDIGKAQIPVGSTYSGDAEASLPDIVLSLYSLGLDARITPGLARITASTTIVAGQAVNMSSKLLRLADASLSRPAIGICIKGALVDQKALIVLGMGHASGLTGLTDGASIYLGNAGALLFTKPGAGMIQGLGFAMSTTDMFVTISQP